MARDIVSVVCSIVLLKGCELRPYESCNIAPVIPRFSPDKLNIVLFSWTRHFTFTVCGGGGGGEGVQPEEEGLCIK